MRFFEAWTAGNGILCLESEVFCLESEVFCLEREVFWTVIPCQVRHVVFFVPAFVSLVVKKAFS